MMLRATASWRCDFQDASIYEWRVYVAQTKTQLGKCVAIVPAGERSATWDADDQDIVGVARAIPATKDGVEAPWDSDGVQVCDVRIDSLEAEAEIPETIAVAAAEPSSDGRVTMQAPPADEPPGYVQVIDGAGAAVGKLLAEVPIHAAGPMGVDGAGQVSVSFPLEGEPDTNREVTIRKVTNGGRPTDDVVTRTIRVPPLEGFHAVTLASVSGATHTGFPAPASGDAHEFVATYGLRLRIPPKFEDVDDTWGDFDDPDGLFSSQPAGSQYLAEGVVESEEFDLGEVVTFRLGIHDTIARVSAAGFMADVAFDSLAFVPFDPLRDDRVIGTPDGVQWVGRELYTTGTPRQPHRRSYWEVAYSTSTGFAHADANYRPFVPNQWIRARALRVRVHLIEPAGWHETVCPTLKVVAYVPQGQAIGSASPEGVVVKPPGSTYGRTAADMPVLYEKLTGLGSSGWAAAITQAPPTAMAPPGLSAVNGTDQTAFTSNKGYAVYIGKAQKANPTIKVVVSVATAYSAGGTTWAEVAIASGRPIGGAGPALTTRGSADVSATFNSTGAKTTTITTTGVEAGDDLWVILGSQSSGTVFQVLACIPDALQSGVFASKTGKPSTMSALSAFTVEGSTVYAPRVFAFQS